MNVGPYILERQGQPMAWIMMGAPGSGKSTWIKTHTPSFAKWLDIDGINKGLFNGNASTLSRASNQAFKFFAKSIERGDSVIMDGTGANAKRTKEHLDKAKAAGYKVFLVYIDVPEQVAVDRAEQRYQDGGRFIPEKRVRQYWHLVRNSWLAVRHYDWDKVWHIQKGDLEK